MRPLFTVNESMKGLRSLKITKSNFHAILRSTDVNVFQEIVDAGYIEFLDVEEEEGALIAFDIEDFYLSEDLKRRLLPFTHTEIHPAMILGVCASIIPFGHHN